MPLTFRPFALATAGLLLACAGAAHAQSGGASCSVSASGLDFGPYLGTSPSPSDITATIAVDCAATGAEAATVSFSVAALGLGPEGTRSIINGVSTLRYQLFLDPARSLPWGDGTAGSSTITGGGVASSTAPLRLTYTVYGRLLARQLGVRAGRHAETVPVLLTYQ